MATTNRTIYTILGLLASGPKTGYDIKQLVEQTISHFWKESYGHLYPSLSRLLDDGLIERNEDADEGGRERKEYRITNTGRAALTAWLHEPVEAEGVRNELALKLYFARAVGPEVARKHLLEHRNRHQRQLALYTQRKTELETQIAAGDQAAVYDLLTLSLGIHVSQARIAWCDEALHQLM